MPETIETLGKIITDEQHRDAVHIAVAPVVAAVRLLPGQEIGFIDASTSEVGMVRDPIGIVDPFLKEVVQPKQKFWLWLYPGSITSLRHEWEHPAFEAKLKVGPPSKEASEAWLREWIKDADCPDYDTVMDALRRGFDGNYVQLGDDDDGGFFHWDEYLHFNGRDAHEEIPAEFWAHAEIVLDMTIPKDKRVEFFSCSC